MKIDLYTLIIENELFTLKRKNMSSLDVLEAVGDKEFSDRITEEACKTKEPARHKFKGTNVTVIHQGKKTV